MPLDPTFLLRFLAIVVINVALSGDNVMVIGMAAASLPHGQRRMAILVGGSLAVALRVALTLAATVLLQIPLLPAIGGVTLFWVAWNLLAADTTPDRSGVASGGGLRRAIKLILIADLTMSVDNVLAVAGTADGDTTLLLAGILISAPLLLAAGGAMSLLIDRFRGLVYLGAAIICFTGVRMLIENEPLESYLSLRPSVAIAASLVAAVALPLSYRWFHRPNQARQQEPGR